MPRYNVQNPDTGLWACFSGICDEFITDWMSKDEYEAWRRKQYGVDIEPAEACNMMDYEEAMQIDLFMKFEQGEIAPVVHAHWIRKGGWSTSMECSNCGLIYEGKQDFTGTTYYSASGFCPKCGAKMDEGEL